MSGFQSFAPVYPFAAIIPHGQPCFHHYFRYRNAVNDRIGQWASVLVDTFRRQADKCCPPKPVFKVLRGSRAHLLFERATRSKRLGLIVTGETHVRPSVSTGDVNRISVNDPDNGTDRIFRTWHVGEGFVVLFLQACASSETDRNGI
ncbi:hypothetical protein RLO149_c025560 [Roseobacter litoralis Och 149]|uniref:Uncharacterized protein n=1 Tax=Roseobacter litoralis (strain ATCC 49566 / DSM 6996 / JCM 21268 / NBRC 15278 / OCh 149) TaxID=391595 RepID=F7ZCV0_ROSLO|nr:hypothetical protein RLO149_c025560 [Roseobacter litoralis Och 149]